MTIPILPTRIALLLTLLALPISGCKMDVINPGVVDATTFDPTADAPTLSLSAQSNFYKAYGSLIPYSAFFSGEAYVGAVRQETNDIGRRVESAGTADVGSVWSPLQKSLATNELAIPVLAAGANAASDINLARVEMNSGFSLVLMAETFCQGDILVGPPLTPVQLLDTAIVRFTKAVAIGTAAASSGVAEGTKVVNASNVGMARAYLQIADNAHASQAASLVPANFVYNVINVDDASNRTLGNLAYQYDIGGALIVVADAYRALNDPRVPWKDAGKKAQDSQLQYYQQLKFTGYATPIRIASGLEAAYILAEANLKNGDATAANAIIASQRQANGQPVFTGSGTPALLAELMNQRARDFWLEAKHLGDWVRNPAATPFVGASGSLFYKPAQGNFGTSTCLPVPLSETSANPHFPPT